MYYSKDGTCVVVEHNHRLQMLWELGVKYVPAVVVYDHTEENNNVFTKCRPPRALMHLDINKSEGRVKPEMLGLDVLTFSDGEWRERTVRLPRVFSTVERVLRNEPLSDREKLPLKELLKKAKT